MILTFGLRRKKDRKKAADERKSHRIDNSKSLSGTPLVSPKIETAKKQQIC